MKLSAFIERLQAELQARGDVDIWVYDDCGGWEAPGLDDDCPPGVVTLAGNHPQFGDNV